MKMLRNMSWHNPIGHTFVPTAALCCVKALNATTEFHCRGSKLCCKGCQTITVHEMCLEPQSMDTLFPYHLFDKFYGLGIQFHCRTGIYDIKYTIAPRNFTKHILVYLKRRRRHILVIIAESTLAPTATPTLQQHEFTGHTGMYKCIPIHCCPFSTGVF